MKQVVSLILYIVACIFVCAAALMLLLVLGPGFHQFHEGFAACFGRLQMGVTHHEIHGYIVQLLCVHLFICPD